jgi:hydrogenase maturation protein HypF
MSNAQMVVLLEDLGHGADGTLWGGEFLYADDGYYERVGTFKPVALLGGQQALREPWRNTYAHLMAEMGWNNLAFNYRELELVDFLKQQPLATLNAMLANGVNAPLASSCERLFDAVAAAIGVCREHTGYEGQAALELEAIVDEAALYHEDETLAYPFGIPHLKTTGLPYIEPLAMWQAVLGDLILHTRPGIMAARFHRGLAKAIVHMIQQCTEQEGERLTNTVSLSGSVFQNRILFEQVEQRLLANHYQVLSHSHVPAHDGSLSLGQAVIALAHLQRTKEATYVPGNSR